MRRVLFSAVLLLTLAVSASAQDVLSIGSGAAPAGGAAALPVSVGAVSGNPMQGLAFKVLYPTELVASVTFARAGAAASATPRFETTIPGTGFFSYVVSFDDLSLSGQIGTLTVTLRGDATPGTVAALTLDPPSAVLSNEAGTTIESVSAGALSLVNGSVTVSPLPAPVDVVATAVSVGQVNVSWSAVGGADHYQVWRSSHGSAFAIVASPSGASFSDTSVSASTTYLYRVRALDVDGGTSPFSNTDAATTVIFTDDPLVARVTRVRLVHITQLRTAVNAFRAAANLAPLATDATIAAGQRVRATHITALRTGLNQARSALGLAGLSYTDPTLTAGVAIKAAHVQQLRNGVK